MRWPGRSKATPQGNLQGLEFNKGDVIDQRFEVLDVRRGYMGLVYIANDLTTHETVALKSFQSKFTWVSTAIDNFMREAEVWLRLGAHPNIVQARQILNIAGRPHIVMEFVNGASLRDAMEELDTVEDVIDVAIQICWGMQYAFERCGIVHRDLKPDNVMVREDGLVKVTDFGLAQNIEPEGDQQNPDSSARITRQASDIFRGSQPYMSPEQRVPEHAPLGPWSDIYSVGVMIFELLTGELPFRAPTVEELTRLHMQEPPPNVRDYNAELPSAANYIIGRCMAKRAEDRYRSFSELEHDLQLLRQHVFGGRLAPPKKTHQIDPAATAEQRGLAHSSFGEHEEALKWFRIAMEQEPHVAAHRMHAAAAEMELMHYNDALRTLQGLEHMQITEGQHIELLRMRGTAHEQIFQMHEALQCYRQMLNLNERHREGWAGVGRVLINLNYIRDAEEAFGKAIKLYPHDPQLWVGKAQVELILGLNKQALQSYDQALRISPRDAKLWAGRAECLVRMKKTEEALECFRRARSLDPSLQEAHAGVAECKRILGIYT